VTQPPHGNIGCNCSPTDMQGWSSKQIPGNHPIFGPSHHAFKRRSLPSTYEHMSGEAIRRLRPSGAVIYIWAEPPARVGPVITPRRSLSHRTVWGSYTQRRTYTSGSASRPPGRAAPIPPNTNTSCITRILFFRGRYEIPVRSRKVFSARQHPDRYSGRGPGPVDDTGSGRDFAGQIPIAGNSDLPQF